MVEEIGRCDGYRQSEKFAEMTALPTNHDLALVRSDLSRL